jgi:hypothetical protein
MAQPSSRSSGVSTAREAANGSRTNSPTWNPARSTARRRFCKTLDSTVTRYTSASSREPVIPIGSLIPGCWSMM